MAGIGQDLKKIYSDETRIVENASLCSGGPAKNFHGVGIGPFSKTLAVKFIEFVISSKNKHD